MKAIFTKRKPNPALAIAEELAGEGKYLEAVEVLVAANHEKRDGEIERRLVTLRHRAFGQVKPAQQPPFPDPADDGADLLDDQGIPSVAASDLTADVIRRAVLGRGCLVVRGLVDPSTCKSLSKGIDRVFDGRDAVAAGADATETTPWFDPFVADPEFDDAVRLGRGFVNKGSGTWTADSPRLLFDLLETYEENGVRQTITDYLGERPAISVNKGTLRRVAATGGTEWWHQDGAFLGEGIRSLNIWLSLTASGKDAPGMDVVAKRLNHIVEPGSGGADFDWSLGDDAVREVAGDTIRRPIFEPGDALLFDHLHLHRTGTDPGMTKTRYAIETWFFAPSAYPDPHEQVPLVYSIAGRCPA